MDTHPEPPPRGFPVSEFEERTARAQRLMSEAHLDALLLTTEPEFRYFSGFLTQFWESPTRPWFLIVPAEGKPVAVVPEIGAAGLRDTWIDELRTWPAPRPADEGISLLVDALKDLTSAHGRIGVPMGAETHLRMPLSDYTRLHDRLPGTQIIDAAPLVRSLRMTKSDREVDKIRHACSVTSDAFEALPERARLGQSEREICRRLKIDLLERGADTVRYLIAASGPGGYDNIIMGPTDRTLDHGDLLIIDTGATYDGYFCDFDRNFAFGEIETASKRAHDTVYRATEAGLEAARPGATAEAVWRAMWAVLEEGGALGNDVGRSGHGLGMQLTEPPSLMPGDDTVLEAGMVITLEPGMTFAPGKLMVHEENIVVRDGEPELLSRRAPTEIPLIR